MVGPKEPNKYSERFHRLCVNTFEKKNADKSDKPNKSGNRIARKKPGDKLLPHNNHLAPWARGAGHRAGGPGRGREATTPQHLQLLASMAQAAATIEPVEMESNASRFAIFAAVRAAVLESDAKLAQILCAGSEGGKDACCIRCVVVCKSARLGATGRPPACRCHGPGGRPKAKEPDWNVAAPPPAPESDYDSYEDEADEAAAAGGLGDQQAAYGGPSLVVPQIVGAGLRGLFELIAEARAINPMLCTKALRALFDVIQGQQPEAFRAEPADMMQPLYELLLELATKPVATAAGTSAAAAAVATSSSSSSSGGSSVLNIFSSSHQNQQQQQQQQQAALQQQQLLDAAHNWSAIGCSALLGLCVARGDTGKTLRAIAALLMSPPSLAQQSIQLPLVMGTLQRSMVAVALGRPTRPDYLRHGVPQGSMLAEFHVADSNAPVGRGQSGSASMAVAGPFVYLLLAGRGLLKVGSGFGGTLAGFVYARNPELGREVNAWIGIFGGQLHYKRLTKRQPANDTVQVIDQKTLLVTGTITVRCPLPATASGSVGSGLVFSDGDAMLAIYSQVMPPAANPAASDGASTSAAPTPSKDGASSSTDSLVVRVIHMPAGVAWAANANAMAMATSGSGPGIIPYMSDLMLKLARKKFRTLGYAVFEEEVLSPAQIQSIQTTFNPFEPLLPQISTPGTASANADCEIASIKCGKEFGLIRSASGRVYYYGKAAALGLKSTGKTPALKPVEMVVNKAANITQVAIGHDGIHAILLGEDGAAYFAGTARRGEDGDSSKNRRQPKAVKPKRLAKMEHHFVVHAACNNGTSAFVLKNGKLMMFGKDTAHCNADGCVYGLGDQQITRVALGKAHCVALNAKGQLITFGLNNKGQCGRQAKSKDVLMIPATTAASSASPSASVSPKKMDPSVSAARSVSDSGEAIAYQLCDFDEHHIDQGQCRVCPFCRECTGYNTSCVVSQVVDRDQRQPGANCSCGRGEAGCIKCGACAICIAVQENEASGEMAAGLSFEKYLLGLNLPEPRDPSSFNFLLRHRTKVMLNASKQQRNANNADAAAASPSAVSQSSAAALAPSATVENLAGDTPRVAPLSPARISLPSSSPVVQIACGMHHTVVLTQAGECFTFGSNQYGQLGTGDLQAHSGPVQVCIPGPASSVQQVAAGSNHTVLLTSTGAVLTFGSHAKGQLGRSQANWTMATRKEEAVEGLAPQEASGSGDSGAVHSRQQFLWHCCPTAVNDIGPQFGKKVTWIGASGDQTFFKIDESLITGSMLSKVNVLADKQTILLIPQMPLSFKCIAICRRDGTSIAHTDDQIDFTPYGSTVDALDSGGAGASNQQAALAHQLASADKCNQNVDGNNAVSAPIPSAAGPAPAPAAAAVAVVAGDLQKAQQQPLRQLPAAMAAGRAAVDRMTQSVHEARNQIFDDDQRRKRRRNEAGPSSAPCEVLAPAPSPPHRHHHHHHHHHSSQQAGASVPQVPHLIFGMDGRYGVLWSFDGQTGMLRCYNVVVSAGDDAADGAGLSSAGSSILADDNDVVASVGDPGSYVRTILSPELALPIGASGGSMQPISVSRTHASLNMLACLDILTFAGADSIPGCFRPDSATDADADDKAANRSASGTDANNEYQLVSRFDNFGGGWGYSGHSVEAIRFSSDTDIVLYGFAMFGGRGEYTCKLRLYDLGSSDAANGGVACEEDDAVLLAETEEIPYECPARSKYNIMLPRPITAIAGNWFLVWARIAGPSSDCGSAGQATVTTEDQIVFSFKTSKKANNGTDVNSGQIPSILYRVVTSEIKAPTIAVEADPVAAVSRLFASGVTRECFEALVALLTWSWRTFKERLLELATLSSQLQSTPGGGGPERMQFAQAQVSLGRLVYICRACLRLLRKYCNEIYPYDGGKLAKGGANKEPQKGEASAAETQIYVLNQGASTSRAGVGGFASAAQAKCLMGSSMDATTPTADRLAARRCNTENLQLAECIGDVRALLIQILCDELPVDTVIAEDGAGDEGGSVGAQRIYDECHTTFLACFNVFYPTATLKWNSLCDLLAQDDQRTAGGAQTLPTRLLSAIVGGLCSPTVRLRHTFQLLSRSGGGAAGTGVFAPVGGHRESKSIISPSDNSGQPMLTSMETHQYPVLVEQMIYRTQQEKCFRTNSWTFKDVLVRLLEIIAQPVRTRIENIYNRGSLYTSGTSGQLLAFDRSHNQRLIDNCCRLLTRVLAEIVYQTGPSWGEAAGGGAQIEGPVASHFGPRPLYSTGFRFNRTDSSRTWNTGNFGPDAICFSVNRPGISIAGANVYSGSGSYEYQLELLYNTADMAANVGASGSGADAAHAGAAKWEVLETVTGSYDQDAVFADMAHIKFDRAVAVRENVRYAMRLCTQGARTCSGDGGASMVRGPCGVQFQFYPCELSFNGTTTSRGQLPCLLYYSTPMRNGGLAAGSGRMMGEQHARDTALQIAGDIGRKCTELLVLARNALAGTGPGVAAGVAGGCVGGGGAAAGSSPSDKSLNSSNNTHTIDSEQNITPIEEHLDIGFSGIVGGGGVGMAGSSAGLAGDAAHIAAIATTAASSTSGNGISAARDHFSKRIESFSKGILETLKFGEKRSNNPFEFEIEIGATEIQEQQKEERPLLQQQQQQQQQQPPFNWKQAEGISNGNAGDGDVVDAAQLAHRPAAIRRGSSYSEDDTDGEHTCAETLKMFESQSASIFHTLLPLVFAHIGALASHDPKSSVQILSLIRDILPHVSALNQLYASKEDGNQQPAQQQQQPQPQQPAAHNIFAKDLDEAKQHLADLATTSNHYCIVESDHPYRSATINTFRVEFPPSVQWFTLEFDPQCGTAQPEDCLFVSIPPTASSVASAAPKSAASTTSPGNIELGKSGGSGGINRYAVCKNAAIATDVRRSPSKADDDDDPSHMRPSIVRQFNTPGSWSQAALVLPGNRVDFMLETATQYARDPLANRYGFRCLIVGYESPIGSGGADGARGNPVAAPAASNACLSRLECELAYLGGMCSANLMRRDLLLPGDGSVAAAFAAAGAEEVCASVEDALQSHASLLAKGLALADSVLTVNQALDTYLPMGGQSNERQFLKDFVSAAPGSAGARLAAWLQPEPRLDPNRCELKAILEPVRFGWPTQLQIVMRDQYGDTVYIPDLKIEIKATPAGSMGNKHNSNSSSNSKSATSSQPNQPASNNKTHFAMPLPPKIPYEPTIKDTMYFKAITFMKPYQAYSFEELRLAHPTQSRTAETLVAADQGDQTFGVQWTPSSVGTFCLTCTIDGVLLEEVHRVEVKDAGNPPPPPAASQRSTDGQRSAPNKQRRFVSPNSAGLRIRAHPTLQSEMVGVVEQRGVLAFVDEQENDDGVWLRLSTESIRQHCSAVGWYPAEAWCLQYNQHLGRTLLHPVVAPPTTEAVADEEKAPEETFEVVLQRSLGTLKQAQDEQAEQDSETPRESVDELNLSPVKQQLFDFAPGQFAPVMASSNPFLGTEALDCGLSQAEPEEAEAGVRRNWEQINPFSADLYSMPAAAEAAGANVGDETVKEKVADTPPFDFAGITSLSSSMSRDDAENGPGQAAGKLQSLQKWFKGADGSAAASVDDPFAAGASGSADAIARSEFNRKKNELSELAAVSVRDLVKAIGGGGGSGVSGGQNGNEASSGVGAVSAGSSPVAAPAANSAGCSKSDRELSDRSIVVSSLGRDPATPDDSSPGSFKDDTLDTIAFTGGFSESAAGDPISTQNITTDEGGEVDASATTVATARQSAASNSESPIRSPRKLGRQKRAAPPAPNAQSALEDSEAKAKNSDDSIENISQDTAQDVQAEDSVQETRRSKSALPASLAESLRAVFAAFLWHEGIVHDAMACASFLKFHPELPKDSAAADAMLAAEHEQQVAAAGYAGALMTREQRAQQRYSVEVANAGNYLNIRPSTLETLTKSGNSSLLNRRARKMTFDAQDQNGSKLQSLPEVMTVSPPALRCLVYLWDQICSNCVQIGQSNMMASMQCSAPMSGKPSHSRSGNKSTAAAELICNETDSKKSKKKKIRDEGTWCELCEIYLPIPVTYHMRIVHPGCERSARGKGYNSGGTYCEGWAGNCGEGGKGASSWYLMCDNCREKYLSRNRNVNNVNNAKNEADIMGPASERNSHQQQEQRFDNNLFGITSSQIVNSEVYAMMRENSMFLLELSASSPAVTLGNGSQTTNAAQKRSSTVSEMLLQQQQQLNADFQQQQQRPGTSRAANQESPLHHQRTHHRRTSTSSTSVQYRRSEVPASSANLANPAVSPELLWQAPESFACLESLGTSLSAQQTQYTIFDINSAATDFERPLSEVSVDSTMSGAGMGIGMASSSVSNIGSLTRFHRSMSMGQGWPAVASGSSAMHSARYVPVLEDASMAKVVMRRRNNAHMHPDDGGSLLLCHPSENLRKLVPDTVLAAPSNAVPSKPATDFPFSRRSAAVAKESAEQIMSPSGEPDICLLTRSSMVFILEQHNLERLRYSLKRNLRISTCRIYALQSLNWLMRSVTQPSCLHDLMWWFANSLKPMSSGQSAASGAVDAREVGKHDEHAEQALDHPISSNQMGGKISQLLTQSFHAYLQTVADLTLLLPAGTALQQCAIQCFGIKFRQSDHQFLHRSHVFGNISKILSRSDEQQIDADQLQLSQAGMLEPESDVPTTQVATLADLTAHFELTVSSRPAMAVSLTDGSTETFWESDEEDRNKVKTIELSVRALGSRPRLLCIHIDNSRDIQNRVSGISFYAGTALGDFAFIRQIAVNPSATTGIWLSTVLADPMHTSFRIELRGSDPTLRARQIRILGELGDLPPVAAPVGGPQRPLPLGPRPAQCNAAHIQQRNCEAETLRVFRLITAQVFGKLILNAASGADPTHQAFSRSAAAAGLETSTTSLADSLDLREHMVGILFSRSKLSHLQKQVIVHIVHAIRKETQRAKEDWELQNAADHEQQRSDSPASSQGQSEGMGNGQRPADTYCFEMLSMVLALSGSSVGRAYLAQQHGLLKDLLSLLHTGSDRVQRQVTALLRRMLPEIVPETLGELLGVYRMPPADFSCGTDGSATPFDMNRMGILDIFLTCIAKSLQLQTKVKTAMVAPAVPGNTVKPAGPPPCLRLGTSIDLNVCALLEPADPYDAVNAPHIIPPKTAQELREEQLYDFGTAQPRNANEYVAAQRRHRDSQRNLNQRWFFRGRISAKQAENIIALVRDMASGRFSERWQRVTKAAIAEAVVNLTRLDEVFREPANCVRTATLWLAVASLCVLDKEHVERLSSGRWSQKAAEGAAATATTAATASTSGAAAAGAGKVAATRPLCANHDDGSTPAVVQCEQCGALCGDCDRFLHLSRKTKAHGRTVCKEEEEAIRVELHESCGRAKLFWLLALADSRTLKAMVEFRDRENALGGVGGAGRGVLGAGGMAGSGCGVTATGRCRFCGVTGTEGLLAVGNVCADPQCQQHGEDACAKSKPCGHACGGVAGETRCLPCLEVCCHEREAAELATLAEAAGGQGPKLTQDADDMCMVCFVEALSCAPAVQLECGHVFHYQCCKAVLQKRWNGPRIGFGFSQCPICKVDISHELLTDVLAPINELKNDVKRKAVMRLEYEGHLKPEAASGTASRDVAAYAMDRYAYYVCFKCNKAYYGGEARCDAEIGDKFDPEELVCGGCSDVARAQMCPKHGTDFLEYKCRYCCAVAVFFCFGTTHFCDTCHDDFQRLTNIPRAKLPHCPAGPKAKQLAGDDCPLHVVHPPTGEEFALGCGVCRNAQTF